MPVETVTSTNYSTLLRSVGGSGSLPPVEIVPSKRDGLPVPRIAGKTIHSLYDPRGEARRFVDAACQRAGVRPGDTVAVLGNGFGYYAEALHEIGFRPAVFEPSRALFCGMAAHREPGDFLGRTDLFLLDDPADLHRSGEHRRVLRDIKAVLPLPYLSFLHPGFAQRFEAKVDAIRASVGAFFKVSVVFPLAGGSLEIARYAVSGLRANGFAVDPVDVSGFGGVPGALRVFHSRNGAACARSVESFLTWCSERIVERIAEFDPAVVVVLAQAPLSGEHVRRMREQGRRVAFWFVEDHHLFRYWEEEARHYDLFLSIQNGSFPGELERAGQPCSHYLPLAADESVFRPLSLSREEKQRYGSPLSFMGAGYYNRRRFFNALLSRPFKIWGTEWPDDEPLSRHVQDGGRRIPSNETAKIFNATQVNLNLHSSTSHEGVNPFGDFVNPRTFEIAACGAFQLVDRRSHLPDLFRPGTEMACFDGRADFLEQVEYYLSRPGERDSRSARARARVLREHTYRDRMREMVEILHELSPPERERLLPTAAQLSEDCDDPEWKRLLARFAFDRPLDLDRLVAGIREADPGATISGKEAVVLLLDSLRHE